MERRYMISDAAKMVDVESHVLRYWEEELEITVPRNEMGHRYYTDFYIKLFKAIKDLKDQGFLLKAIKILMPELMEGKSVDKLSIMRAELGEFGRANEEGMFVENHLIHDHPQTTDLKPYEKKEIAGNIEDDDKSNKMQQFQMILGNIVVNAVEKNNETLSSEVSQKVSESVIKEMDYLLRLKEEREEERFKKIDELIRNYQRNSKEPVASGGKRGLFRRK